MAGPGRPFQPGNKAAKGRPTGSRNKLTLFKKILDKDGIAIIEQIKTLALNSHPVAMKLCIERLIPVLKTPNARFELPPVETAADLTPAISAVTQAVAEGRVSAQEGEAMAKIIESQRRMVETEAFDVRLKKLEKKLNKQRPGDWI